MFLKKICQSLILVVICILMLRCDMESHGVARDNEKEKAAVLAEKKKEIAEKVSDNQVVSENMMKISENETGSETDLAKVPLESVNANIIRADGYIDDNGIERVFIYYNDEGDKNNTIFLQCDLAGNIKILEGTCEPYETENPPEKAEASEYYSYVDAEKSWINYDFTDVYSKKNVLVAIAKSNIIGDIYMMDDDGFVYPCEPLSNADAKAYLSIKNSYLAIKKSVDR